MKADNSAYTLRQKSEKSLTLSHTGLKPGDEKTVRILGTVSTVSPCRFGQVVRSQSP